MSVRREIKSYVLRQGRLTPGQQKALENFWPRYGLSLDDGPLDLNEVFPTPAPVTLEIGFGRGDSLAKAVQTETQTNFIGIEVHRPGVGHFLRLVGEADCSNVRVFSEDGVMVLQQSIVANSLDKVQVFFPDPWHKKRHHKRRLVNESFIELIASRLKTGGLFHIATDWVPYAEEIEELVGSNRCFKKTTPPMRSGTKFERRGERLGHEIRDMAWQLDPLDQ